jgi:hypothetical protein
MPGKAQPSATPDTDLRAQPAAVAGVCTCNSSQSQHPAADAKEVGVGNPAEETTATGRDRYPKAGPCGQAPCSSCSRPYRAHPSTPSISRSATALGQVRTQLTNWPGRVASPAGDSGGVIARFDVPLAITPVSIHNAAL